MNSELLKRIGDFGRTLANQPDREERLVMVLRLAQALTQAKAALLLKLEGGELRPVAARIDEREIPGNLLPLRPIPVFHHDGRADTRQVASFCVHQETTLNQADISASTEFDSSLIQDFAQSHDFHVESLLVVPFGHIEQGVIAVLLLMNSATEGGFSPDRQRLVETLAWQAGGLGKDRPGAEATPTTLSVIKEQGLSRRIDRALLAQRLSLAGVPSSEAKAVADEVFDQILAERRNRILDTELEASLCAAIDRHFPARLSDRFRAWNAFRRSGLPLLVLIGGGSGSGKSTLASELGLRLDIGRIHSTDTLREVMRLLVSEYLAPELHRSTYQAWQVLPRLSAGLGEEERVVEGFRAQADKVAIAVRGVVQRSIAERESAILEGAHLHPLLQLGFEHPEAVTIPLVLVVPDQEELKRHFQWRSVLAPTRSGLRHLEHFEDTWRIQRHLIEEAAAHGVAVIANVGMDFCVRQVLELISHTLLKRFPPSLT